MDPNAPSPGDPGDPSPAPSPSPSPGPASPASPPAAQLVVNNPTVSEADAQEVVELRRKLSEAENAKKAVEMRNSQLEDENTRLRSVQPRPARRRPLTAFEAFAEEGPGDA